MMVPNQNFLTYFPEVDLPELKYNPGRSSCLKIGAHLVIRKMFDEYNLPELLGKYFDERELGLFLDIAAYSLVCENNAGQYYPMYAYNHPLFTESMHIYSDSKVSDFLCSMSGEESIGFLNDWNSTHDHREKIYISYDSTNKNSEAGNIDMVEFGNPKVDVGSSVFNYSIAYDTKNAKPLFYETYLGSCESSDRGKILKVLAELTDRSGFDSAVNTVSEAIQYRATDPDSLQNLYRRIYSDVPLLPPLDIKTTVPNAKIISISTDLSGLDAALRKGGRANG